MRTRLSQRVRSDAGFTLIECLVASAILAVGVMGTFAMVDGASGAQDASRAREGATNLAREFLEAVRADAYTSVTPSVLAAHLQGMPGYGSMSGSAAVITRRSLPYSVTASVCSVDDPKDGLGTTDPTFCSAGTPTSPADNQPDDLKRVAVSVTWPGRRATTITQATMMSSTGAVIGLPLQTLTMDSPGNIGASATAPIITTSSTTVAPCAANRACFTASSTGAKKILFAVDGADQSGSAVTMDSTCTGPCPKWHFTWDISGLSDGVYRITARSVDPTDVEGTPKSILVTISRNQRYPVCGVGSSASSGTGCRAIEGGYNDAPGGFGGPYFEVRWQPRPERNVVGYVVETGTGGAGTGTVVCRADAQGRITFPSTQTPANAPGLDQYACIDESPPTPSTTQATYQVYARYSDGATGTTIDGPVATAGQQGQGTPVITTPTKTLAFDSRTNANDGTCTKDLTDGWAGSGTGVATTRASSMTMSFCSPTIGSLSGLSGATSIVANNVNVRATVELDHNNSGKDCTATWSLASGATALASNGTGQHFFGGGNPKQTAVNDSMTLSGSGVPLNAGDKVKLTFTIAPPGSNCSDSDLRYSGSPTPGWVQLGLTVTTPGATWARPNPPTSVTKTAPAPNINVSWTAPAAGNVAFYRIYRDGQTYQKRYDVCDVGDLATSGGCDNGINTFTYTDQNTGGTTHSYWVTAVYGTSSTPPIPSTMAESSEVAAT